MSTPYGLQITENCVICKLRHSGFFCDLPKQSVEDLDKIKYASAFPPGAVLFVEGQSPRGVYIICSGRVKLTTTSRDGKTLILRIAEAGEVLAVFFVSSPSEGLSPLPACSRDRLRFLPTKVMSCTLPSASRIAAEIRSKSISPLEVARIHLERIERLNPQLNAFVDWRPELVLHQAQDAEKAVMRGEVLGPLHGVPLSIKASIDVA